MLNSNLDHKLASLPHRPGVYLMYNRTGEVLYVGKANDLYKRVHSYFTHPDQHTSKTATLVSLVTQVRYIITKNEQEALVLENTLIKKYQPKYNVLWRDDKSYPYLKLTKEPYPRLFFTRQRKINDNSAKYFGPYPKIGEVKRVLRFIYSLFPLRPCKWDITAKNVSTRKKIQSCLYKNIDQCPAPCTDKISAEEYNKTVTDVVHFLQGKYQTLITQWEKEMYHAAETFNYELAALWRDRIYALNQLTGRVRFSQVEERDLNLRLEIGNAISELKTALSLPKPPVKIEAVDVSTIFGNQSVGSLIVFTDGEPTPSEYRRYRIRTVRGIDDTAMIREIILRRYARIVKEKKPLPDLVLIDGGKGQLHAAKSALDDLNLSRQPVISLAKQEETIFVPDKPDGINLPAANPGLLYLRRIRDEAHRFAITYHRLLRKKTLLNQENPPRWITT